MFGARIRHEREDLCDELRAALGPDVPNPVFMDSEIDYIRGLSGGYRTLAIQQAVLGQLQQHCVNLPRQNALTGLIHDISITLQKQEHKSISNSDARYMYPPVSRSNWVAYDSPLGVHHPYDPSHVNCIACAPENDPPVTLLPYGTTSSQDVADAKRKRRTGVVERFGGLWSNSKAKVVPIERTESVGSQVQDPVSSIGGGSSMLGAAAFGAAAGRGGSALGGSAQAGIQTATGVAQMWAQGQSSLNSQLDRQLDTSSHSSQEDRQRLGEQKPYRRISSGAAKQPLRTGVVIPIDQYSDYMNLSDLSGVTNATRPRKKKPTEEIGEVEEKPAATSRMVPASRGRKFRND